MPRLTVAWQRGTLTDSQSWAALFKSSKLLENLPPGSGDRKFVARPMLEKRKLLVRRHLMLAVISERKRVKPPEAATWAAPEQLLVSKLITAEGGKCAQITTSRHNIASEREAGFALSSVIHVRR